MSSPDPGDAAAGPARDHRGCPSPNPQTADSCGGRLILVAPCESGDGRKLLTNNAGGGRGSATGLVLLTLAAGQFVMALDTTVMNTAIATVAKDVGTTVTGIQTAITLYTLVMASLMITGGKVGEIIGRERAFAIGCVIYACGWPRPAPSRLRWGRSSAAHSPPTRRGGGCSPARL